MKTHFFLTLAIFFFSACNEREIAPFDYDVNVCDPADNPDACPQTLRDDASYRRDVLVGDEGFGIEVNKPNEAKIMEECRLAKRSLISDYVSEARISENPDRLTDGEFINSMEYKVVSEGKNCTKKVFGSCTKSQSYVRVVCVYKVFFSPTLRTQSN
jgi:hypothetical protein